MVVRDFDILLESRYINFEKKCMVVVRVTTRMVLYLYYDKLHIINICTTYNLWNVHKFYSFRIHCRICTLYSVAS